METEESRAPSWLDLHTTEFIPEKIENNPEKREKKEHGGVKPTDFR